jgi:hypothetical protein
MGKGRGSKDSLSRFLQVHLTPNFGTKFLLRGEVCNTQNVRQLRGRLEGLLCIASEITGFFALLSLKPKSDRISLRGGMVNSQSAKDLDMISFDLLW